MYVFGLKKSKPKKSTSKVVKVEELWNYSEESESKLMVIGGAMDASEGSWASCDVLNTNWDATSDAARHQNGGSGSRRESAANYQLDGCTLGLLHRWLVWCFTGIPLAHGPHWSRAGVRYERFMQLQWA